MANAFTEKLYVYSQEFLQRTAALGARLFTANRAANASTHRSSAPSEQVATRGGYLGNASGSLSKVYLHGVGPVGTMKTPQSVSRCALMLLAIGLSAVAR